MSRIRSTHPGIAATLAAIGALPEEKRVDALLQVLQEMLRGLPTATLKRKRARLLEHFSQCGCSYEVCCAVQDLVALHLARRSMREAGTQANSRRGRSGQAPRRR